MQKIRKAGFTLIEILVVIGIIAILATIVLIAINPARQFAQARNTQRTSNVEAILNAIGQRYADNKGLFHGTATADPSCQVDIPTITPPAQPWPSTTGSKIAPGSGNLDIRNCLVTTYMAELPVDPTNGVAWNATTYDTAYNVFKDSNGRVTVFAPSLESGLNTNPIFITR